MHVKIFVYMKNTWFLEAMGDFSSCMKKLMHDIFGNFYLFIIVILCDQNLHAFLVIKVALEKQSVCLFLLYVNDVLKQAKTWICLL